MKQKEAQKKMKEAEDKEFMKKKMETDYMFQCFEQENHRKRQMEAEAATQKNVKLIVSYIKYLIPPNPYTLLNYYVSSLIGEINITLFGSIKPYGPISMKIAKINLNSIERLN